ncbi:MAG: MBL fold metallo-hydrolase [Actinobacteria bacterium]|nr:MBL fold metallo-hydrolase [Actinomycetota bacterium]
MDNSLCWIAGVMGRQKPLNQYILMSEYLWVWIDAGISTTPDQWIFPELEERRMVPPTKNLLVITHADVDHFGGASALKRAIPSLVTMAHEADRALISDIHVAMDRRYDIFGAEGMTLPQSRVDELCQRAGDPVHVDIGITSEVSLQLGDGEAWKVLHLPGHSEGHLALWNSETRAAVIGDAAMGWGVVDGEGALQPPHYMDVEKYLSTIDRLRKYDPRTIYCSHRAKIDGFEVANFLKESSNAVEYLGLAIDAALGVSDIDDPQCLKEVCEYVSSNTERWPGALPSAFASSVAAHLRLVLARVGVAT